MRVSVTRREETNYVIEHNDPLFFGADLPETGLFIDEMHSALSRPHCCARCTDENDDFKEGGCPCQTALSSL